MPDAAGHVVLAAVAGAEPAAVLAARVGRLVAQRNAAEMGADADDDEELLVSGLDAGTVGLAGRSAGSRAGVVCTAFLISSSVRLRTKIGLPRQTTVMAWPSGTGARSTSMLTSASTSLGRVHAVDERPGEGCDPDAATVAVVMSLRKSRFDPSGVPGVVTTVALAVVGHGHKSLVLPAPWGCKGLDKLNHASSACGAP